MALSRSDAEALLNVAATGSTAAAAAARQELRAALDRRDDPSTAASVQHFFDARGLERCVATAHARDAPLASRVDAAYTCSTALAAAAATSVYPPGGAGALSPAVAAPVVAKLAAAAAAPEAVARDGGAALAWALHGVLLLLRLGCAVSDPRWAAVAVAGVAAIGEHHTVAAAMGGVAVLLDAAGGRLGSASAAPVALLLEATEAVVAAALTVLDGGAACDAGTTLVVASARRSIAGDCWATDAAAVLGRCVAAAEAPDVVSTAARLCATVAATACATRCAVDDAAPAQAVAAASAAALWIRAMATGGALEHLLREASAMTGEEGPEEIAPVTAAVALIAGYDRPGAKGRQQLLGAAATDRLRAAPLAVLGAALGQHHVAALRFAPSGAPLVDTLEVALGDAVTDGPERCVRLASWASSADVRAEGCDVAAVRHTPSGALPLHLTLHTPAPAHTEAGSRTENGRRRRSVDASDDGGCSPSRSPRERPAAATDAEAAPVHGTSLATAYGDALPHIGRVNYVTPAAQVSFSVLGSLPNETVRPLSRDAALPLLVATDFSSVHVALRHSSHSPRTVVAAAASRCRALRLRRREEEKPARPAPRDAAAEPKAEASPPRHLTPLRSPRVSPVPRASPAAAATPLPPLQMAAASPERTALECLADPPSKGRRPSPGVPEGGEAPEDPSHSPGSLSREEALEAENERLRADLAAARQDTADLLDAAAIMRRASTLTQTDVVRPLREEVQMLRRVLGRYEAAVETGRKAIAALEHRVATEAEDKEELAARVLQLHGLLGTATPATAAPDVEL